MGLQAENSIGDGGLGLAQSSNHRHVFPEISLLLNMFWLKMVTDPCQSGMFISWPWSGSLVS